jgi:hypothetical protein
MRLSTRKWLREYESNEKNGYVWMRSMKTDEGIKEENVLGVEMDRRWKVREMSR